MPLTSTGSTGCSSSTGRYRGFPKICRVEVKTVHSVGRALAQQLEERELARGVDLEVEQRLAHRVDVAHLAGQVEHEVGSLDRRPDRGGVRDVHVDDGHRRRQRSAVVGLEVARVGAVAFEAGVDDRDDGARVGECERQVRADEASSPVNYLPLLSPLRRARCRNFTQRHARDTPKRARNALGNRARPD